ncbi:hypothetical protein BD626DRAFT_360221, partial [Schizophyllum amplum]
PASTTPRSTQVSPGRNVYVVFIGRKAGVYTEWADCRAQVSAVKHNSYKSFGTLAKGQAAFAAAHARGLTFSCGSATLNVGRVVERYPMMPDDLPLCLAFIDDDTSTAMAAADHIWYVVFAGTQPGVYRTYHEAALATTGLNGAKQRSYMTRVEAEGAFKQALYAAEVHRLV